MPWPFLPRVVPVVMALVMGLASCAVLSASDPTGALRERYLDRSGVPSPALYARLHGTAPASGSESFAWRVVFRLAYRADDVGRLPLAEPIYTDCYFVRRRSYKAACRAQAVWDGRVYPSNGRLVVAADTLQRERVAGYVNEDGRVQVATTAAAGSNSPFPDFEGVRYNPFTGQLWRRVEGGSMVQEQRFYLPLPLVDGRGRLIQPEYRIVRTNRDAFALVGSAGDSEITLAQSTIGRIDPALGRPGYAPLVSRGCTLAIDEPTVLFEIPGEIANGALDTSSSQLVLRKELSAKPPPQPVLRSDGRFDEWRNIPGVADPEHDVVSYLQHNLDTDLLEFKVASDAEYLYFYTCVAGRHGNTKGARDRYYFYVHIDADRNPATGYIPTRDDDCYFGVALGDDCEAQFEFVDGRFVKTFFGLSPDGSECEMRAALTGFLRTANGDPILAPGQRIDLAAGVEASGKIHGNTKWGADSTAVIHGYSIGK